MGVGRKSWGGIGKYGIGIGREKGTPIAGGADRAVKFFAVSLVRVGRPRRLGEFNS
jgi:hypothetical protein